MNSLRSYFYRLGVLVGYVMPPEILLDCAVHFRDLAKWRGIDRPDDKLKAKNLITLALEAEGGRPPHIDNVLRHAEANGDADIVKLLKDWLDKHEPTHTLEIGAIESTGEHKGEIYGGIFPDGKPGWILEEPKPVNHYDAVELKGRALPTSEQGKYIDTIKDKGALKDIFARHSGEYFGGYLSPRFFWLAEHSSNYARCQQFSDGNQNYGDGPDRDRRLAVLSVFR